MVRKNIITEICEAITEIKKILESPNIKSELLIKTLEKRELELFNKLYEAVKKKTSRRPAKQNTPNNRKNNDNEGDQHETR